MAKKNEIEKLSPGACIESLRAYHEAVYLLTITVSQVLKQIQDEQLREILERNNLKVKSFYE